MGMVDARIVNSTYVDSSYVDSTAANSAGASNKPSRITSTAKRPSHASLLVTRMPHFFLAKPNNALRNQGLTSNVFFERRLRNGMLIRHTLHVPGLSNG